MRFTDFARSLSPAEIYSAISQLRSHAFAPGTDKRPIAAACLAAHVRPRTAKKWSVRLCRKALPRAGMMRGLMMHDYSRSNRDRGVGARITEHDIRVAS